MSNITPNTRNPLYLFQARCIATNPVKEGSKEGSEEVTWGTKELIECSFEEARQFAWEYLTGKIRKNGEEIPVRDVRDLFRFDVGRLNIPFSFSRREYLPTHYRINSDHKVGCAHGHYFIRINEVPRKIGLDSSFDESICKTVFNYNRYCPAISETSAVSTAAIDLFLIRHFNITPEDFPDVHFGIVLEEYFNNWNFKARFHKDGEIYRRHKYEDIERWSEGVDCSLGLNREKFISAISEAILDPVLEKNGIEEIINRWKMNCTMNCTIPNRE